MPRQRRREAGVRQGREQLLGPGPAADGFLVRVVTDPSHDQVAPELIAGQQRVEADEELAEHLLPGVAAERRHAFIERGRRLLGHRVQQFPLALEVPVDAGHTDVEECGQLRHRQVLDRRLAAELEGASHDVGGVNGPAGAPLARPRRARFHRARQGILRISGVTETAGDARIAAPH
jgi:hypothetical protein